MNRRGTDPPDAPALPFLGLGSAAAVHEIGDLLSDGLFTTDADGRITFWNRAAERITGWARAEAVGRDCSLLAGDAARGCACGLGPLRCGLAERERASKTCTVRARDGRLLQIVKSAVPLLAPDGTAVGALETFVDVAAGVAAAPRSAGAAPAASGLVGDAPAMEALRRTIALVARSDATVLVTGESGTGKERVAEAIHASSARAAHPFVRASCAALGEPAPAGRDVSPVGPAPGEDLRARFREAGRGTLLLDELGDLSPLAQLELLRVLEERDRAPAAAGDGARLVCASHQDLPALVEARRFRADLYFRLAVFPLRIPPLRERARDVAAIGRAFLARRFPSAADAARIRPAALAVLEAYPWPGNVRELQNVLEFAALQAGGPDVDLAHLPPDVRAAAGAASAPRPRAMPGPEEIAAALAAAGGNRAAAARRLGISRVTLWKRLKDAP